MQLYFGALVAGLRAGRVYNTWPDIDGAFIPSAARLFFEEPWWRNLFDNPLTVQFEHRMTAYALLALAILHAVDAIRSRAATSVVSGAVWLAAAMILQAVLGILTLLHQVPIDLALAHQAVGDGGADAGDFSGRATGGAAAGRIAKTECAGGAGRLSR